MGDPVYDLASQQYGLITARQAITLGVADRTLRHYAEYGWRRPHIGVYELPGAPRSHRAAVMAALLGIGEEVYTSRWTAAWLHGLVRVSPSAVQVTVPYDRGVPVLAGVEVCRSRTWSWEDTTTVEGLTVANGDRMVGELAACTQMAPLRSLVIDVCQRQLGTREGMAATLERMGPVHGAGKLRRILWQLHEERCDSELERLTRAAFRARPQIPRPHPEPYPLPVRGRVLHIDVPWPQYKVGVECLGMAFHSERAQLEVDARRSGLLAETDWRIFPVTWWRIETDADAFCEQVRRALMAGRSRL